MEQVKVKLLLTVPEVAELLGMPQTKIRTLCRMQEFPSTKIGKSWYINNKQLHRWADGLKRAS